MGHYFSLKNQLASSTESVGKILEKDELLLLQGCMLDIYSGVLAVSKRHGLHPLLVGGSLLGKKRHNGFIPWDNDLDIGFSRKEYELLIEYANELEPKYMLTYPGEKGVKPCNFVKVYKVDSQMELADYDDSAIKKVAIDVFPIDYVPDNRLLSFIKAIESDLLMGIISSKRFVQKYKKDKNGINGKSIRLRINIIIRFILNYLFWFLDENNLVTCLDKTIAYKKESQRCTIAVGRGHYKGETLSSSVFFPLKESDFCGYETWIPNKANEYLSNLYGDYMEIPPPNKREHDFFTKLVINGKEIV